MKRVVLGILSMAAISAAPAFAGTMGPVAEAPWAGFYLGGNVGYTWFESKMSTPTSNRVGQPQTFHSKKDYNDFLEGIHGGFNWQSGNIVFGAEAGIDATQVKNTYSCINPDANVGWAGGLNCVAFNELNYTVEVPWEADIVARLGMVWNDALIYATGGVSFADVKNTFTTTSTIPFSSPSGSQSFDNTRTGGTIGAGIEYMFTPSWIGRVEYRYSGYSTKTFAPVNGGGFWSPYTVRTTLTENTVRVGLSYLFGH